MPLYNSFGSQLGEAGLGSTAYEADYFSGSQIFIMVGDVMIDSVIAIGYEVSQK